MGFVKVCPEQFVVQLGQLGPLISVGAFDGAEIRSLFHRANLSFGLDAIGHAIPQELRADNFLIERHVMGNQVSGLPDQLVELIENGSNRLPFS